jgi:hypothetical protein
MSFRSIVFQVLVSKLYFPSFPKFFFWFILKVWWRFERLIVIVVDTFSVFVYTVFIYLYAVMLLRQKFKNSHFHESLRFTTFLCSTFFIGQHSGMSVLTS